MMAIDGYSMTGKRIEEIFNPAHFSEHLSGPTSGIVVWSDIMFDTRAPLVFNDISLAANCYIRKVVVPAALSLWQVTRNTVFQ